MRNRDDRSFYRRRGYQHQNCPVCGRTIDMLATPNDTPLFDTKGNHLTIQACSPGCLKARNRLATLQTKLASMTITELKTHHLDATDDIAPRARGYILAALTAEMISRPKSEWE